MNFKAIIVILAVIALCFGVQALEGSGDSAVGALDTKPPVFAGVTATPPRAAAGDTVTITFTASKSLYTDPGILVNGNITTITGAEGGAYTCTYEVAPSDALGMATISIAGEDTLGNLGSLVSDTALEIISGEAVLPLVWRPWTLALLLVMAWVVFRRLRHIQFSDHRTALACGRHASAFSLAIRRFRGWDSVCLLPTRSEHDSQSARPKGCVSRRRFFLFVVCFAPSLVCLCAVAQGPEVSHVRFVQQRAAAGGTEVVITYDLDAPNGPCDITVSLSKDGGADAFSHAVTSITGALSGITTGADHIIIWDIAADYPDEDIPNAQMRVTADDGVVAPHIDTFFINSGATTTTDPVVTLDNTATKGPTEYMASESQDFSGASWRPYGTAPSFALSAGEGGMKTVYFRVRNAAGESAVVSDTIDLVERTILLPGDVPLPLRWIPSGSFLMGRYPGEVDSYSRETPQHLVTLVYGFWMGKYAVTQQQWIAVRGAWPGTAPSAAYGQGNTYPAYYISWNDAKNFITSLNAHIVSSGQGPLTVRLPSEAEWEYACRAGTQTRFYWGDDLGYTQIGNDAWYSGNNSPNGSKPVGGKTPNAFGLYDMSGNVYELCEDDWHGNYTGAPADGSAWIDSPRASYRVVRGGFWSNSARYCRSAFRGTFTPGFRFNYIGFRLAAVE